MFKLLVNNPEGIQELISVQKGGEYFDKDRVLWDEREDGEFPKDQLENVGGLSRSGKGLSFDQAKFDAQKAQLDAKKDAEKQKQDKVKQARQLIRESDLSGNPNLGQLLPVIRAIVDVLK